ncbi:MAG: hypothetical protein AMS17_09880 [Spirochaetes bacterium DG_61]|jgi:2-amino-4-hydroxy-6-hydroxymethyldihydropteridine diphosphokinase|nr:MAG: hypothetical protein AMS17_09880 [Spirochaetes bacterium DG_61]
MSITYLGLGSNQGDRERNLRAALSLINARFMVLDYSSIYHTSPVGYKEQPHFLNMVVKIDSGQTTPTEMLYFVKKTESDLGRTKTFHWGPRKIDIDILYMEDIRVESEDLTIPHKELFRRDFVLVPLSEITDSLKINNNTFRVKDFVKSKSDLSTGVTIYKTKEDIVLYDI